MPQPRTLASLPSHARFLGGPCIALPFLVASQGPCILAGLLHSVKLRKTGELRRHKTTLWIGSVYVFSVAFPAAEHLIIPYGME